MYIISIYVSLSLFFHHPCNKSSHPTYVHTVPIASTSLDTILHSRNSCGNTRKPSFLVRCFQWILNLFPHILSTFIKHGQPKKLQRRQPPTTLPKAWYSLLAALFMELGFVEVATRQAPRTCDRTGAWKQVSYL